MSRISKCLKKS